MSELWRSSNSPTLQYYYKRNLTFSGYRKIPVCWSVTGMWKKSGWLRCVTQELHSLYLLATPPEPPPPHLGNEKYLRCTSRTLLFGILLSWRQTTSVSLLLFCFWHFCCLKPLRSVSSKLPSCITALCYFVTILFVGHCGKCWKMSQLCATPELVG